eukprot:CAMPEP_0202914892 /NCGR_PEP_ID=MMETSP1392-20130828/64301_1 /ASSEMBLY_ACC=CAM_ASM_000868 /TAXON_ID=225041 /ORGANISM="Chlamydomonas chlamydogama, Strain SAG 11-48b" /LENGTH=70 /DNA_ID=CAMNT_0049606721 /DNA_START=187 /DNA_END=395 /DNA_ORIENTATION=+
MQLHHLHRIRKQRVDLKLHLGPRQYGQPARAELVIRHALLAHGPGDHPPAGHGGDLELVHSSQGMQHNAT